jgi:hypothetical protein
MMAKANPDPNQDKIYYKTDHFMHLTGASVSQYENDDVMPGAIGGIRNWAPRSEIQAEKRKWMWITQAVLKQPAARQAWDPVKSSSRGWWHK